MKTFSTTYGCRYSSYIKSQIAPLLFIPQFIAEVILLPEMTRVYPNGTPANYIAPAPAPAPALVLTVWKKSLLLNCDGFTVFDAQGNLVFRVDNYVTAAKGGIVLMDASGNCVLTVRRKKLSLADHWLVYDGETAAIPRFSVRKHVGLLNTKSLAHVTSKNAILYVIEGSYTRRCCTVYDDKRTKVAEIKRKEAAGGVAFGSDVFRLIVQPDADSAVAMALVILLDQMFGSSTLLSWAS